MTDQLRHAIIQALNYVQRAGVEVDQAIMDGIKTLAFYQRGIDKLTRELYRGDIDKTEFENGMVDLIDQQLDKAWRAGMDNNELDPSKDMTPEFEAELERIKLNEVDYVTEFGQAIIDAAKADTENETPKESLPGLYSRAEIWATRYTDVVNQAQLFTADKNDRMKWVYGDTEHCDTCMALNGVVATAEEWQESGFTPQAPPNDQLDCGGWQCKCSFEPTGEKVSPNRFDVWDSLG